MNAEAVLGNVYDSKSNSYHVTGGMSNGTFVLRFKKTRVTIGEALGSFDKNQDILLKNIEIYAPERMVIPFRDKFLSSLPGYDRWPRNFRRLGLGTELLNLVIQFAKTRKAGRIYGQIVPRDLQNNPSLLDWFRKFGFQEFPGSGMSPKDGAICVELKLS